MLNYELYKVHIKEGEGDLFDYYAFCSLGLPCLAIDLMLSPIEILAFIMWKLGGKT